MSFRKEIQKRIDALEDLKAHGLYTDVDHAAQEAYEEVLDIYETAEKKERLINDTLHKVREEVEGLQTYLLFSGDTKKVELESVLEIIDRVKQELNKS